MHASIFLLDCEQSLIFPCKVTAREKTDFSVVYVLFINRFKLIGFNWLIKLC